MGAAFSIMSVLFAFKEDDFCPLTSMKFIPLIANLLAVANTREYSVSINL